MTNFQQRLVALTGSACPKKATELFYVSHPKAPKPLMGPFLCESDAELGRVVLRSADALVTSRRVDSVDDLTYWHGVNNGEIVRVFAVRIPAPLPSNVESLKCL